MARRLIIALFTLTLPLQASALTIWERIDATYTERSTESVLPVREHMQAAEAARHLGKSYDRYQRLMMATALTDNFLAKSLMEEMNRDYAFVDIAPKTKADISKLRIAPQFEAKNSNDALSIAYAQGVLDMGYGFRGMLPVGSYVIGRTPATIEAGNEFTEVRARAAK